MTSERGFFVCVPFVQVRDAFKEIKLEMFGVTSWSPKTPRGAVLT